MDEHPPDTPLADLIRENRDEILARWLTALKECAPASRLTEQQLVDHLPVLLDRLITALAGIEVNNWTLVELQEAEHHAVHRLDVGMDLRDVATEFFLLRHILLTFISQHREHGALSLPETLSVGWVIDAAIRDSVEAYAEARHRLLEALDHLSRLVLESHSLDELLPKLLHVIVDMAAEVDTVALFLLEGETLSCRAAAGPNCEVQPGLHLALGEGVVGRVALEKKPMTWPEAGQRTSAKNADQQSIRAIHALPLIAHGELLGVLQMTSTTASDFPDRDRVFLRATADRISAGLLQHALREEAQRAAKKQEELAALLDSIYAAAPVGFGFLDRELRLVRANSALTRMTGVPTTQEEGDLSAALAALPDLPDLRKQWLDAIATGQPRSDVDIAPIPAIARDRGKHWVASWYPVRVHDETVGLALTLRDVTVQKESQLFQQRVLGIVSHDMRTPLMAIKLSADSLMREQALSERQRSAIARVGRGIKRLEAIVRDLLDLTRASGGRSLQIERRGTDLGILCTEAIEEIEATQPGCQFHFARAGDTCGNWDPDRLSQVLVNLLTTAVTYHAAGTPVTIRCLGVEDHVGVEVENQGAPISNELAPHIFEAFRRGQADRDQGRGGLGLNHRS